MCRALIQRYMGRCLIPPPLGWRLTDQQVADVLTDVRNIWDNAAPPVAPDEVAKQRRNQKMGRKDAR